jgi:hypothetical protein
MYTYEEVTDCIGMLCSVLFYKTSFKPKTAEFLKWFSPASIFATRSGND